MRFLVNKSILEHCQLEILNSSPPSPLKRHPLVNVPANDGKSEATCYVVTHIFLCFIHKQHNLALSQAIKPLEPDSNTATCYVCFALKNGCIGTSARPKAPAPLSIVSNKRFLLRLIV